MESLLMVALAGIVGSFIFSLITKTEKKREVSEFVDENPNKEYNAYQPKEDIVLYADKAYITEGDFVLVSLQCYSSNIDIVTLQLDNGYKLLNYSIDANGQKEFKISVFRNVLKISIIYRKGNIQDVKSIVLKRKN